MQEVNPVPVSRSTFCKAGPPGSPPVMGSLFQGSQEVRGQADRAIRRLWPPALTVLGHS